MYFAKNVAMTIVATVLPLSIMLWIFLGLLGAVSMEMVRNIAIAFVVGGIILLAVLSRLKSP